MIGKYFDVLGLPSTAKEEEVRKRYRELVKLVHPDLNDSSDAHQQFVKLTDAYNVLLHFFENSVDTVEITSKEEKAPQSSVEEDWEAYRKYAAEQYRIRKEKEKKEHERWFSLLRMGWRKSHLKFSVLLSFLVFLATALDWFLPFREIPEIAKSYSTESFNSIPPHNVCLLRTQKGSNFWIANYNSSYFSVQPFFKLKSTYILHQPVSIKFHYFNSYAEVPIHFTVYWAQFVLIPILLIPMFAYFYRKNDAMYIFLNIFSRFISLPLVLLMLLTDDRWLHLASLGFI